MTDKDIEQLIEKEALRRTTARHHISQLAAFHAEGLTQRCAGYRRRTTILRAAAACCLLTVVSLASFKASATPPGTPRIAGNINHADAVNTINSVLVKQ